MPRSPVLTFAGVSLDLGGAWTKADLLAIVALILTLVALGFTIQQIRKTLTAAQATQSSVKATLGKLARDEMLGLIGDLQRVDRDLRAAVDAGQPRTLVGDRLADWRDKGYGLWELVRRDSAVAPHVRDELLESAKIAAELLTKLPEDVTRIPSATKSLRGLISRVCGQLATLDQQLRFETGET